MLPFNSQGATSALEDGGALGALFRSSTLPPSSSFSFISSRLALFQCVRAARVARVQLLSSARLGREMDVEEEVKRWADPPGSEVPKNMEEHVWHGYA